MDTPLRDVLREKAKKYEAQAESNKRIIVEWRSAVDKLFERLKGWLPEVDPDQIIKFEISDREVVEPGLGRYKIASLNLYAFGKWVGLIPKARKTIKKASPSQNAAPENALGRVDMTDELRRFVLYRFRKSNEDDWVIHDIAKTDEPKPLTRAEFESALLAYFR
jgi:hypothetical protein